MTHLPKPEIPELTWLRFAAAFCVLVAHTVHWLCYQYDPIPSIISCIMRLAGIGMPLFFVLSGFVIHYNYNTFFKNTLFKNYPKFIKLRFARLYPLYILCIIVCLICFRFGLRPNSAYAENSFLSSNILYFITMTQSFIFITYNNLYHFSQILLGISWSVSTEFFFYFCYPFLAYFIFNKITRNIHIIICICYFILIYIIMYSIFLHQNILVSIGETIFSVTPENRNIFNYWFIYLSPYIRIFEFIAGCLAAQFVLTFKQNKKNSIKIYNSIIVLVVFISILFLTYYDGFQFVVFMRMNFLLAFPFFLVLCSIGAYRQIYPYPGQDNTLLGKLGAISYSIYLLSAFTISFVMIYFPAAPQKYIIVWFIFKCIIALFLTIGLSFLTYKYIELPGKKFIRSFHIQCKGE